MFLKGQRIGLLQWPVAIEHFEPLWKTISVFGNAQSSLQKSFSRDSNNSHLAQKLHLKVSQKKREITAPSKG